eukprot:Awhi_evm2s7090
MTLPACMTDHDFAADRVLSEDRRVSSGGEHKVTITTAVCEKDVKEVSREDQDIASIEVNLDTKKETLPAFTIDCDVDSDDDGEDKSNKKGKITS